ncbi:MAG: nucleotidyltransferase family protein [Oscillospiraceae bacterium]|nr:nucleotidyltransferase family protein [Oscillospiraceae bacterium]MDD4367729.1 nucleotidyltransferase family protein [Oscillospiraceae bacterium]
MQVIGVVTEYNPFHLGHVRQLEWIRNKWGPDTAVIAVMSASFTQRGEPACLDMWTRCAAALAGPRETDGVDLVLALPTIFSCAAADDFAFGAVSSLTATGVTDAQVCGMESADSPSFNSTAKLLYQEPLAYKTRLKQTLAEGQSFAAAQARAAEACLGPEVSDLLASANNILALAYEKARLRLIDQGLNPPPLFRHERLGEAYLLHAANFRQICRESRQDQAQLLLRLSSGLPPRSLACLLEQAARLLLPQDLGSFLFIKAAAKSSAQLAEYFPENDGLAQRLADALQHCAGTAPAELWETLCRTVMTRNLPRTRVQRAFIRLLLDIRPADLQQARAMGPAYLRVLGFNKKGRWLLKQMRQKSSLPIINQRSDFEAYPAAVYPDLKRQARLDLLAYDLQALAAGAPVGNDFDKVVLIR